MTDAAELWAAKTDAALLEAATDLSEFTEEGERIIRAELQRRGLPPPAPPIGLCPNCGRSIASGHIGYTCAQCGHPLPPTLRISESLAHLVTVLRTGDPGLLLFAKSLFEGEGIEYIARG